MQFIQTFFRAVRFDLRKGAMGVLLAALAVWANMANGGSVKFSAVIAALFLLQAPIRLKLEGRDARAVNLLWAGAVSMAAVVLMQMCGGTLAVMKPVVMATEWMVFSLLWLVLFALTGRFRLSICVGLVLHFLPGWIWTFAVHLRGAVITVGDLTAWKTALNVADNYRYFPMPSPSLYTILLYAAVVFSAFALPRTKISRGKRLVLPLCILLCGILGAALGLQPVGGATWRGSGVAQNGVTLNVASQLRAMRIQAPEGYDPESIEQLADQYAQPGEASRRPTVIAIMSEAYADLSVLGKVNTDREVTPFFDSLVENTIRGHALVSTLGGGTAKSEWEVLTGCSASAIPSEANPYLQYVEADDYSLAARFKEEGYYCMTMHPFNANGWNRPEVYRYFGFEESLFVEDFPQEDLVREFVSDREMVDKIISCYEQKGEDPLFLFGVTMQNHAGFTYEGPNFEPTVSLVGYDREYPEAEQYLSLLSISDQATQQLIEYFQSVEEDVVILFFGDHMPKLNDEFFEALNGGPIDTFEEEMRTYQVPFFVWANYDIPEQTVELTSLNYLSAYLLRAAGLEMPPWQTYLRQLEQTIPAINQSGYYSNSAQAFLPFDQAQGEEAQALAEYMALQYNCLFDDDGRNFTFFPAP